MKENNKFSLSAFFCSLGYRSKLYKLVLLGAPFFLVQIFTLKVYASSVAVSGTDGLLTNPSGGVTSPIHNVLKMDTGSINSSLWVALGLDPLDLYDIIDEANEAYQDGNQVVYDAIIDALNDQDAGSGDLLDYVIQSSFQASSQSGYVGKISIPDDVWNRVNKASKNGLNLRITSPAANISASDFYNTYCTNNISFSDVENNYSLPLTLVQLRYNNNSLVNRNFYPNVTGEIQNINGYYCLKLLDQSLTSFHCFISNTGVNVDTPINSNYINALGNVTIITYNNEKYLRIVQNNWNVSILTVLGGTSVSSKHLGVASDFITNKANESYDIVSKSSTYDPDTGKIVGARSVNLITPAYLSELVASLRDGILSLPEALQRLGIGAIDTDQAIPIGVGFDIDTLSHVVAQSVPQEATAAATREAFRQLDNFTFYTPDDFVGVPSVAPLPVAMNWLAVQMQTMMGLTSFQNCWVVLSTLAVLSLLVGLIRLSK